MSIDAVDSNSGMVTPQENATQDRMKGEVLRGSLGPITGKIERLINRSESQSLGFVLEKKWNAGLPLTPNSFIKDTLGLGENDSGHAAEMKIHESVFAAFKSEYEARLTASKGNVAEQEKLKALWTLKESSYRQTRIVFEKGKSEIHLGGVPEYWLPEWVKAIR